MHYSPPTKAIVLLLGLATIQNVVQASQEQAYEGMQPHYTLDLGLLKLHAYFKNNMIKDKMRLADTTAKHVISFFNPMSGSFESIDTAKLSYRQEIIECDSSMKLIKENERNSIDCKPLESFNLEETQQFVGGTKRTAGKSLYVQRSRLRVKVKPQKSFIELQWFPVKQNVTELNIDSIVADLLKGELDFFSLNYKLGFYFEASYHIDKLQVFQCAGNSHIFLNQTDYFTRMSNDPYPENEDEIDFIIHQAINNGILYNLKSLDCSTPDSKHFGASLIADLIDVGFRTDFTVIYKKDFPYLTLRHTSKSFPDNSWLDYVANIHQSKNVTDLERTHQIEYDTHINIKTTSSLYDGLNFVLDQTFFNSDENHLMEYMSWVNRRLIFQVSASDDPLMYVKSFVMAPLAQLLQHRYERNDQSFEMPGLTETTKLKDKIQLNYIEDKDDNQVTISLIFNKNLIKGLTPRDLLESLIDRFPTRPYGFVPIPEADIGKFKREKQYKHLEL